MQVKACSVITELDKDNQRSAIGPRIDTKSYRNERMNQQQQMVRNAHQNKYLLKHLNMINYVKNI